MLSLFKRKPLAEHNNAAYTRHLILKRGNQFESDTEDPNLEVSIAEMRETVDDFLEECNIHIPDKQLDRLLRELNFHRDNAAKFQSEFDKKRTELLRKWESK